MVKKELRDPGTASAAHPGARSKRWFQDQGRVGQKGRVCHRAWLKGQRPAGLCDRRSDGTDPFATVRPATDANDGVVRDQAGWHHAKTLRGSDPIKHVPLPPYSPGLNSIERIWLFCRERFLSLGTFPDEDPTVDA